MRIGRALVLSAMLAVQPMCVFGDGTVSPPNPEGEKLWRAYSIPHYLPIPIILVCGILLAWLLHRAQRKAKKPVSNDAGSYQI